VDRHTHAPYSVRGRLDAGEEGCPVQEAERAHRETKYEYILRRLFVCGEYERKMDYISIKAKSRDLRYPYYS
jgi:hypothetical protein